MLAFLTPDVQAQLAEHNRDWSSTDTDFGYYLRASELRYRPVWETIVARRMTKVCDVGGFWGALPLALVRCGVQVTMSEALRYYSASFDPLFAYLRSEGVEILDFDPFDADPWDVARTFDLVTVMAVLEHYPHSLRQCFAHLGRMAGPLGRVWLEVPNIAYLPKRWAMLHGRSPLVSSRTIWRSKVPFTGHHHEYTVDDLADLIGEAGWTLERLVTLNYSQGTASFARSVRRAPLRTLVGYAFPSTREVIGALCHPSTLASSNAK